jgi:hypothetical protein
MSIDDAARATRRYVPFLTVNGWVAHDRPQWISSVPPEAQAACDRLNLAAVLRAIREPSEAMIRAGKTAGAGNVWGNSAGLSGNIFSAMIDALIAECDADA